MAYVFGGDGGGGGGGGHDDDDDKNEGGGGGGFFASFGGGGGGGGVSAADQIAAAREHANEWRNEYVEEYRANEENGGGNGEDGESWEPPEEVKPAEPEPAPAPEPETPAEEPAAPAAAEPVKAEEVTEPKRSGEERAEKANVVYTGGGTTTPPGTGSKGSNAAGTKLALSEAEDADWLAENGLSWAAPKPEVEEAAPKRPANNGYVPTDMLREQPAPGNDQQWLADNGLSWAANVPSPVPQVRFGGAAQPAANGPAPAGSYAAQLAQRLNGIVDAAQPRIPELRFAPYVPGAAQPVPGAHSSGGGNSNQNAGSYAEQLAERVNDFVDAAQPAPGLRWSGAAQPDANGPAPKPTPEPSTRDYGWFGYNLGKAGQSFENLGGYEQFLKDNLADRAFGSEEERVQAERELQQKYNEMAANGEIPNLVTSEDILSKIYPAPGSYETAMKNAEDAGYVPGTREYDQSVSEYMREAMPKNPQPASGYMPYGDPRTGNGNQTGNQNGKGGGNQTPQAGSDSLTRPGADSVVESWSGQPKVPENAPDSVRFAQEAGQRANDYFNRGTGAGTGTGTGNKGAGTGTGNKGTGTGTGNETDVPKGSQYFRPSYGQEMERGVKAPYRKGGYTEEELRKMGNAPRTDFKYNMGKNAYEGYYLAPDGHYYPVDQLKANYYMRYGTYKGWEEGMRDYWNTFGTFYGYRPGWQQTGKAKGGGGGGRGGGGRGGGGGYSYNGNGKNYGAGQTANNGLYWNPNTSWSI